MVDQPNIPGTVNEHPNWRQRLPVAVEDIAGEGRRECAQGRDAGARGRGLTHGGATASYGVNPLPCGEWSARTK